jgi:RNA-directed DNA polymerase
LKGRDYVAKLMSPTQQKRKDILFEQVTSRSALLAAWLHVRPRLERSKDEKTRSDTASFGANVQRSIAQLQSGLRNRTFSFEPQKGILKHRKAEVGALQKLPRPIVIAPARSRIVQRAVLDVCQSDESRIVKKLGSLVEVVRRPTSVGGLPDRGVPEAITLIRKAIQSDATWFVRSDLKNFFQDVPKESVSQFLNRNVSGPLFNQLFMEALKTELANEGEVRELMHLFPTGLIGVPQGSALSALCANIVLSDFDVEFNRRGIVTVRYLDDFVMLGKGKRAVESAYKAGEKLLKKHGFECHDPFDAKSKKAAAGPISEGFDFLSLRISPESIVPTRSACADFLEDLNEVIQAAKSDIQQGGGDPRRSEPRYVQALVLLDKKVRGWGDAFRPSTDRLIFAQLDEKVGALLDHFALWYERRVKSLDARQRRRSLGVALLVDTPAERGD